MPAAGWQAALDPAGKARDDAQVAELTGLLREAPAATGSTAGRPTCASWCGGRRASTGRNCHCSSRSTATATSSPRPATRGGQPQRLEARHRVHARVEGFIRCAKDTGLARWPSQSFAINTAWVTAVALAIDLLCWMRLLLLDGPLAKAEPATLRYRLLHAAARLVKRSRHLILRVPETWPWA